MLELRHPDLACADTAMNTPRRRNRRLAAILLPLLIFVASCDRTREKDKESLFRAIVRAIDAEHPGLSDFSPFLALFMSKVKTELELCADWRYLSKPRTLEAMKENSSQKVQQSSTQRRRAMKNGKRIDLFKLRIYWRVTDGY